MQSFGYLGRNKQENTKQNGAMRTKVRRHRDTPYPRKRKKSLMTDSHPNIRSRLQHLDSQVAGDNMLSKKMKYSGSK